MPGCVHSGYAFYLPVQKAAGYAVAKQLVHYRLCRYRMSEIVTISISDKQYGSVKIQSAHQYTAFIGIFSLYHHFTKLYLAA